MATISPQSPPQESLAHNQKQWYRPTFSLEHGVYVMLGVSFLTGAAAAQQWTWATTLALICAYCGFQAEHPLVLQIKQRRSWKPRFLAWAGIYGGLAGAIAFWLFWQNQENWSLLVIYGFATVAVLIDGIAVWKRQQKAVWNELITFSAICLSAPFSYAVTIETFSEQAIGLWLLNTVFFSGAIFCVKLRKIREASIIPGLVFHGFATVLVLSLLYVQWLSFATAAAFGIGILKFGLVLLRKDWYCSVKIQQVAMLETGSSFLFLVIVALSLLPSHLNSM